MSSTIYNPRSAEIIMILVRLNLPPDVARLILQFVRERFRADFIQPVAEKWGIVCMIKRVLKPSIVWEGLVDIDVAVIDTGWDCSDGRRNLSTLFRYCGLVERIFNNWGEESVVTRPSAALILMVWQKRKRLILSSFGSR